MTLPLALQFHGRFMKETRTRGGIAASFARSRGAAEKRLFAGIGHAQWRAGESMRRGPGDVLALKRAGPSIAAEHRELYRSRLMLPECPISGAWLPDPHGWRCRSIANLGAWCARRVCQLQPASFDRDEKTLIDGGYSLEGCGPRPIRWSTHATRRAFSR